MKEETKISLVEHLLSKTKEKTILIFDNEEEAKKEFKEMKAFITEQDIKGLRPNSIFIDEYQSDLKLKVNK